MDILKGLDLFKLSAGMDVPPYQDILGPNDIFGLGASLYECASRVPLAGGGPEFLALREGRLDHMPVVEVEVEKGGRDGGGKRKVKVYSEGFEKLLREMVAVEGRERPTAAVVVRRAMELLGGGGRGVKSSHGSRRSSGGLPASQAAAAATTTAAAAVASAAAAATASEVQQQQQQQQQQPTSLPTTTTTSSCCALPQCQAQQQRISALEAMVLSLTGEG